MSSEYVDAENDRVDHLAFRNVLGRFASGVTVVTTVVDGETHGMTASAFVSVSLEPPLVLVSVDRRAHLHQMLKMGDQYGVSILNRDQEEYSNHFAGFGAPGFEPKFVTVHDTPLIDGAIAHIITRVVAVHEAGDHSLFVGQVESLAWFEGEPLLYYRGKYGAFS